MKNNCVELSASMDMELCFMASDLDCGVEELLDAILLAYFWDNYDALKILHEKARKV